MGRHFNVALLLAFLCAILMRTSQVVEATAVGERASLLPTIDCNSACASRCRLASRHNMCVRACGTCCRRCHCVPPGTSGNREACGVCYSNMRTHGGRLKCP